MREGWEYRQLPEVLWFQEGPGVRKHQYRETGVKLLNVANLVSGKIDLSTSNRYISEEEAYGKYKHFLVDAGDFIIASSGIMVETMHEKNGFIKDYQLPLCMNTSTIRFKSIDQDILCIHYFSYFVKSQIFKSQIARLITGIAQLNFGPSHLKKIKIPVPPISTQQQIVSELDLLSHIIDQKRQQLKEYDALAESIFYDMFGDPVENPKGWEVKNLGELSNNVRYGTSQPPIFSETGYKFIRATNIKKGAIVEQDMKFIDEIEASKLQKCKLQGGELLIVRSGANTGDTCVITPSYIGHYAGYDIIVNLNDQIVDSVFVNSLLNTNYMDMVVKPLTKRAAQPHLNSDQVKNLGILFPPLTLQRQFAAKIESIEQQKQLLKESIKETELLFQSRMDYWFNG